MGVPMGLQCTTLTWFCSSKATKVVKFENGWMITAGCVEDIARAMQEAVETPLERINEMGAAGHKRVARQHLASTEAARLESYLLNFSDKTE